MYIHLNELFSIKVPGLTRGPHKLPLGLQDEILIYIILLLIKCSNTLQ